MFVHVYIAFLQFMWLFIFNILISDCYKELDRTFFNWNNLDVDGDFLFYMYRVIFFFQMIISFLCYTDIIMMNVSDLSKPCFFLRSSLQKELLRSKFGKLMYKNISINIVVFTVAISINLQFNKLTSVCDIKITIKMKTFYTDTVLLFHLIAWKV